MSQQMLKDQEFLSMRLSVGSGRSLLLSLKTPVDNSSHSHSETGFRGDKLFPAAHCAGWKIGEGEALSEGSGLGV